jgi:hypothetical protein
MAFDVFSDTMDRRRATRLLFLAIIVLTLPCYCLGFVLLAYAPANGPESTKVPTNATLGGITSTPFFTSTPTPFALTATPTQSGAPLLPTPGQLYLPTATPFFFPSATLTLTPLPQPTNMPTLTQAPTLTASPTLVPTNPPTQTPVPTAVPTEVPLPTEVPTEVPPPTAVPTEVPPPTAVPTEVPPPTAAPTEVPPPTEPPVPTPTQEQIDSGSGSFNVPVEDSLPWI